MVICSVNVQCTLKNIQKLLYDVPNNIYSNKVYGNCLALGLHLCTHYHFY